VLLFHCPPESSESSDGRESGEPLHIHRTLAEATTECRQKGGRVLVLDAARINFNAADPPRVIAPAAVLNLDAFGYRPPESVEAAGGYVVRRGPAGVELLLIFRRGQWDLPKGKLDTGETPTEGAVREVAEEVGVPEESLEVLRPLGTTVHGYPHPRRATYAVKTTHWFAMTAKATNFTPQAEEDIELVEWVPWSEAGIRLRFESLRQHHAAVDPETLGV
jgi:8-oxo-dGTP pyrophosphatase MutT (NUDIX family)